MIALNDVTISYQNFEAVRDVSLTIEKGEFIAVVGPSGCGKSTLLKLLAGLLKPAKGTATINGHSPERAGNVGIAFQNASLMPWRNILQNVLLPLEVAKNHKAQYQKNPEPYLQRAHQLLAAVGLEGFEQKAPFELSGGMQQRANLVRALIHSPEILLLDEPFGALDAFTREELWLALQTLWEKQKSTVVLVTHDLREAVMLSDTVYMMSARPGQMIYKKHIDLPRPRTLETTYTEDFLHIVHDLRERIGGLRRQVGQLT